MEFPLWDGHWFGLINGEWRSDWLDIIMPYWRNKLFWIPLYAVILAWLGYHFRQKTIYFALAVVLTIALADTISSKIIKKSVQRVRPCNDLKIKAEVNLLIPCGSGYSFTSSHATNHFALAFFFLLTIGRRMGAWRYLFLAWAASIAYGQVYVGVHYPLDIMIGGLIGSLIGILVAWGYSRWQSGRIAYFYEKKRTLA